jgi:hypothetical protein
VNSSEILEIFVSERVSVVVVVEVQKSHGENLSVLLWNPLSNKTESCELLIEKINNKRY